MTSFEYNIRNTVYGTLLNFNFLNESEFSIEEIRKVLGLKESVSLSEDAQSDIDTELYAQHILKELMKEYNARLQDVLKNGNSYNPVFNIEDIHFVIKYANDFNFASLPEKQMVSILGDLSKLWTSMNIKSIKHEIIHCLDARRVKDKKAINYSASKQGMEYYTSPLEYNAFSHELFQEILERILDDCKRNNINPRDYFSSSKVLAEFISKTMTTICKDPNDEYHTFLSSLPEDMQRRVFNRMYALAKKELLENIADITHACNDVNRDIFMESLIESILKGNK